MHFYTYIIYI